MENRTVELKTNERKGNYGEMKVDVHFENEDILELAKIVLLA